MKITRKEVISVLVVLSVLGLLLFNAIQNASRKAVRISCVSNLTHIKLSFRVFANDHNELYPMQVTEREGGAQEAAARGEVFRIFSSMSNELAVPKTILCPSDKRTPGTNWGGLSNSNVSYFVGLGAENARPNMLMTGDRNIAIDGTLLTGAKSLGTNSLVGWMRDMHRGEGNVVLADASVRLLTAELLRTSLRQSGDATNRLVFPQ